MLSKIHISCIKKKFTQVETLLLYKILVFYCYIIIKYYYIIYQYYIIIIAVVKYVVNLHPHFILELQVRMTKTKFTNINDHVGLSNTFFFIKKKNLIFIKKKNTNLIVLKFAKIKAVLIFIFLCLYLLFTYWFCAS